MNKNLGINEKKKIKMKTITTIKNISIAIALQFTAVSLYAANNPQEVITINSAKFGSSLVKVWVEKYTEKHPEVQIRLVENQKEETDLRLIPNNIKSEEGESIVNVGRYALLPVTTIENPLYERIAKQRFNEKKLKALFFQSDVLDTDESKKKDEFTEKLTIYSGANQVSGTETFAAHFGYTTAQLRGKKIAGDDIFLLTAIGKDHSGITFNNLAYLYDLQSRNLKSKIALLPLDLKKKEQEEALLSGNLDKALDVLEESEVELVPVEEIGFSYKEKSGVTAFLQWILNEGQQYNHDFGFLTLEQSQVKKEQKKLDTRLSSNR